MTDKFTLIVARLRNCSARPKAEIDGKEFVVANAEEIPDEELYDDQAHLFCYHPQDQFCKYIHLAKLQEEAEAMRCSLSQNDTRKPREFCARLGGERSW